MTNLEDESMHKAIGRRLASARARKKMSLQYVEDRTGIQRSHISEIERGKKSISLNAFVALCNCYEVGADFAIGMNESPEEYRAMAYLMEVSQQVSAAYSKQVCTLLAAMYGQDLSGGKRADALTKLSKALIDSARRLLELNRGFEEDARGGDKFIRALAELEAELSRQAASGQMVELDVESHLKGVDMHFLGPELTHPILAPIDTQEIRKVAAEFMKEAGKKAHRRVSGNSPHTSTQIGLF